MNTMLKSYFSQGAQIATGVYDLLLDVCFPPHCPSCDTAVSAEGNICSECYAELQHISAPMCLCCGIPFAVSSEMIETESYCAACIQQPPIFQSARAVWGYNAISSTLITRLKFGDHSTSLSRYGKIMAQAATPAMRSVDAIVPVPLHWRRLMARRYNQSALLAYSLADELRLPVLANSLKRTRATTPQTRLKGEARARNVLNAFSADAQHIAHKNILLIDDVMTTGATIKACTKALLQAQASQVHVLTLARTTRELTIG